MKGDRHMKYVEVVFRTLTNPEGGNKRYVYKTELDLQLGSTYSIIADNKTAYDNFVKVVKIGEEVRRNGRGVDWLLQPFSTRTITAAKLITSLGDTPLTLEEGKNLQNKVIIPRIPNPIRKVYFNKEKDTTAIIWVDGEKTIFKRDSRDEWDYEKVVAMAFMKKYFNNRAYYYDRLQEIIENAEVIGDEQMEANMYTKWHSFVSMNVHDLYGKRPKADSSAIEEFNRQLDKIATLVQEEETETEKDSENENENE